MRAAECRWGIVRREPRLIALKTEVSNGTLVS
jgi:hypothetical protein